MNLKVKRLTETATLPTRAHDTDAGYDLYADFRHCIHDDNPKGYELTVGQSGSVPTGVAISIPEGHVGLICPRSGSAHYMGLTVLNAPGIIDAGYTGEVRVNVINHGWGTVEIRDRMRVAQLVIVPIVTPDIEEVECLEDTERGANGHGSTGE